MTDDEFPYDEIMAHMKLGYILFGTLSLDLIDQLTDHIIRVHVTNDKEFRELLGEGYYT